MIAFWVVAGVLAACTAGLILFRAGKAASEGAALDPTPVLYRRQLTEIDDLADRGLIGEDERRVAHAEAARRLLGAADRSDATWPAGDGGRTTVLASAILAPAIALGVYLAIGSPGMSDQPFAQRLAAWRASAPDQLAPDQMSAVLQQLTRERPNDPEGLRFLAIAQGAAQNPPGAVRALRRAVKIAPERADLWEMLGEAQMIEAGGDVTPAARRAFAVAVKLDPAAAITSRFHLARGRIASGDQAGGLADWRALLGDIPMEDPRREALKTAIADEESGAAKAALADDQMVAVRGMVAGLAERLKFNPDDPAGWVRLVRAYAVLGQTADRDEALRKAKLRYGSQPDVLTDLEAAAKTEPLK